MLAHRDIHFFEPIAFYRTFYVYKLRSFILLLVLPLNLTEEFTFYNFIFEKNISFFAKDPCLYFAVRLYFWITLLSSIILALIFQQITSSPLTSEIQIANIFPFLFRKIHKYPKYPENIQSGSKTGLILHRSNKTIVAKLEVISVAIKNIEIPESNECGFFSHLLDVCRKIFLTSPSTSQNKAIWFCFLPLPRYNYDPKLNLEFRKNLIKGAFFQALQLFEKET